MGTAKGMKFGTKVA